MRHSYSHIANLFLLLLALTPYRTSQTNATQCPLDFTPLRNLITNSTSSFPNVSTNDTCQYILQGLHLVESYHLLKTNYFLPPQNAAVSCWTTYQYLVNEFLPNFQILTRCGFNPAWISYGCMNITTKAQFEADVPSSYLNNVARVCNQSLENNSPCATCTSVLSSLQASFFNGNSVGNVSDCLTYPSIYAAAFLNYLGPTDKGTAKCLFLLDFTKTGSAGNRKAIGLGLSIGLGLGLAGLVFGLWVWFFRRKRGGFLRMRKMEAQSGPGMGSFSESTNLVKFSFEEIRKATRNFSRHNIVGRGGYGNVFQGELPDGSLVAVKRFKNCSISGDEEFVHEVEMIASVRHVNLLALRGCCTATTEFEGHQRILVCDLISNGSLYDHLFGFRREEGARLSWPIRQKIALGMAKGLAYLHYGVQPGIIHRDVKSSNILLDEWYEPKLGDFGLAKFAPEEGMTHLSTRVAGTMGYVAPEYALYGQLTERSDVYSFGVVLLELFSGRKALGVSVDGQPLPVTDWAWSLVREGRSLDVIEDGVPELGIKEVVEKYVLVAVICSHPQVYARPTMDQVVKMLEMEASVPSIPQRPISLVADMDDIERSVSSGGGSVQLSTPTGYQAFMLESDDSRRSREEGSGSDPDRRSCHEV